MAGKTIDRDDLNALWSYYRLQAPPGTNKMDVLVIAEERDRFTKLGHEMLGVSSADLLRAWLQIIVMRNRGRL